MKHSTVVWFERRSRHLAILYRSCHDENSPLYGQGELLGRGGARPHGWPIETCPTAFGKGKLPQLNRTVRPLQHYR